MRLWQKLLMASAKPFVPPESGYLGHVELGTFLHNGSELPRPTRPWRDDQNHVCGEDGSSGNGNIPALSGTMANYSFGDTSSNPANRLKWHKYVEDDKTIYVCDRNILRSVSHEHLNAGGYVGSGKTYNIDGKNYKCRLLYCGDRFRSGTNDGLWYGGTNLPNEWHRYIMNGCDVTEGPFFEGSPIPESVDWDTTSSQYSNPDSMARPHNQAWWWNAMYSWGQETWYFDTTQRVLRGCFSVRFVAHNSASSVSTPHGFRPALVEE